MKDDIDRAAIMMRRNRNGSLSAVTPFDAELLDRYAPGKDLEVTIRQRRSLPMQRLYWTVLQKVVEATGRWPSAEKLHNCLKIELGFIEWIEPLKGRGRYCIPDSTAFSKMDQSAFAAYFDAAMKLLAEMLGVDPLASMTASDLKLVLEASGEAA